MPARRPPGTIAVTPPDQPVRRQNTATLALDLAADPLARPGQISADLRHGDAPPLHFDSLPELIHWLADLDLRQRHGAGGIR